MKSLFLGEKSDESFRYIKVTKDLIFETFSDPYRTESLDNGVTLYLKKFDKREFSFLMISTLQTQQHGIVLGFVYWIPEKLIGNVPLINIVEAFAHLFGRKIRIGDQESFFIHKAEKLVYGEIKSPYEIIQLIGTQNIPSNIFLHQRVSSEFNFKRVDCRYCFAINNNKYLLWINNTKTVQIRVQRRWHQYLSSIKDRLDPEGRTGLQILKPSTLDAFDVPLIENKTASNQEEVDLEIPISYIKPFNQITSIISQLDDNQKMVLVFKFSNNRCLFCGSEDVSSEHIFPKWLKAYISEKKLGGSLYVQSFNDDSNFVLDQGFKSKTESSHGYTIQCVCVNCNGTWLSKLEESVKGILTKNAQDLKTIGEIDFVNSANSLALWIIVKSVLISIKYSLNVAIPIDTLQNLKDSKIPNGFIVEVCHFDKFDLDLMVNKGLFAAERCLILDTFDRTIAEKLASELFTSVVQIGHIVFRVTYFDESCGLHRETRLKKMKTIFPRDFEMPFTSIENDEVIWKNLDDKIRLTSLSLTSIGLNEK